MMKKRACSFFMIAVLMLFGLFTLTSCQKTSYGDLYESQARLAEALYADGLSFQYPGYMGADTENAEHQYVAVSVPDSGKYNGYKIYCFGSPFYTSVTAFDEESDSLLSDEEDRTPFLKTVSSAVGEIKVYAGKGHKDALYLIGCFNDAGRHYEIRITSDEEMQDNQYIHAIYEGNQYYSKAFAEIQKIAENIK